MVSVVGKGITKYFLTKFCDHAGQCMHIALNLHRTWYGSGEFVKESVVSQTQYANIIIDSEELISTRLTAITTNWPIPLNH